MNFEISRTDLRISIPTEASSSPSTAAWTSIPLEKEPQAANTILQPPS
jgi:hypothetical protein